MSSAADLIQAEVALLTELLPTLYKVRYAALANTCIILFEHILTFDQEIIHIWRANWSFGKVLFLVNRYYALVPIVFNNFVLFNSITLTDSLQFTTIHSCKSWILWQGATGILDFVVTELILILRLYAMYFGNKRVLSCSLVVFVAALGVVSYIMVRALPTIGAVAVKFPAGIDTGGSVCVPTGIPSFFFVYWIPMIFSESVYLAFALYRGWKTYRRDDNMQLRSGLQLIEILVRDSVFFFIAIFTAYATNMIVYLVGSAAELEIPIGFAQSLGVVMGSRLCLNVREYIREESSMHMLSSPISPRTGPGAGLSHGGTMGGPGGGVGSLVSPHGGGGLNEVELRELRVMRAPSQAKHARMFSLEKTGDVLDIRHGQ